MAVRVGTTAHDISGLRASSTLFEPFSDVTITAVDPDPITPGDTVTVTTFDSALVTTVYFAGVSIAFAAPTGTTITFTAPDAYLYGDRTIRLEDIDGGGTTVTHSYQPAGDNLHVTLAGYPPGTNKYDDTILHLGEELDPQPANGAQIEVRNMSSEMDFELRAEASYSVLEGGTVQRRIIYEDASASAWDDVNIIAIPEAGDAIAVAPFSNIALVAPTGSAIGSELGFPTNLFTSNITRTSARANWTSAG